VIAMLEAEPEGHTLCHRASTAFASYQAGDRAGFNDLVELLTPLLWHTVRSQGIDKVAAEDVVQTIWMRLLHSSSSIRDPQTVVKWRISKRSRTEVLRTATAYPEDRDEPVGVPAQRQAGPEEALLRDETQRQLWEHISALPERCRELMRVIAFADRPDYALIAESLKMPVGSIGPTRGRCLQSLRDLYEDGDGGR
jgi:RNA polymerase sigma factor (sigma-70 family)